MQNINNAQGIFNNISELFIEDVDLKTSVINKLLDAITINVIITNLETTKRMEFYSHLMVKRHAEAKDFVLKEIPNLNELIYIKVEAELTKAYVQK